MDFTTMGIGELINREFACSCGKTHRASIKNILIGKGVLSQLEGLIDTQQVKEVRSFSRERDRILLVSDVNTYEIAGGALARRLTGEGYRVKEFCFQNRALHAEEEYVHQLQQQLEDVALIITVGSGSLNDITRYAAFHGELPYYIVATAPSMDGYASNVSPIVVNHLKTTFECKCADAIIGDTDLLATAPDHMVAAGLGDIIGKYLSISDWRLSRMVNGEYCCDSVCDLVLYSVKRCVDSVPGLVRRDSQALQYLMESLVLIGIAMSYIGYSRPASSSEHHIAHFLEMKAIFAGEYGELHGTNVGMATCLVSRMYRRFLELPIDFDRAREACRQFDHAAWESEMHRAYGLAADQVLAVEAATHQNDPENVLKRIDAIEQNFGEIRALIQKVVEDTKDAPQLLQSLGGLTDLSTYPLTVQEKKDILLYAKELRSRYAALQFFYDLGVLEELVDWVLG